MLETTSFNTVWQQYQPITLIDEPSSGVTYVGISQSHPTQSASIWQIKKTWVVGNVTYVGYPNGSQDFEFAWSGRTGYTYS